MKRFILGLIVAISLPVMAAVLWPSGAYLETFQNGFIFGTGKVLSVLNNVITFDDKRLDDRSKDIFFQQDFEGSSVPFTCGTDLTAADETVNNIAGVTSKSFTQGATPPVVGVECVSASFTLDKKQVDSFIGFDFYTTYDGNDNEMDFVVYDQANAEIVRVPIKASTNKLLHSGYGNTLSTSTSLRYEIEVAVQNANSVLVLDDIQSKVDPLTPTDIYASRKVESYTPSFGAGLGAVTSIEAYWFRDGAYMVIYGKATSGTVIGDVGSITLPSGYNIDANKVDSVAVGTGSTTLGVWHGSSGSTSGAILAALSTATDRVYISQNDSAAPTISATSVSTQVMGGGAVFSWNARIPIAGWSNTTQGVVVKNRTDSASVENVFSAKVAADGTVSSENVDWIDGNCTNTGTSNYTCNFNAGLFDNTPSCNTTVVSGLNNRYASIESISTSSILAITWADNGSFLDNNPFEIICQRQGTDYIKETDKVYTVDVSQLKGNTVRAEGNGSTVLTSDVTPIDFTEVSDSAGAWDGDEYTVQKNNSILKIVGSINYTASANREIRLYKNNSLYRQISDLVSSNPQIFVYTSGRGDFVAGDVLELRISTGSATTLTNSTIFHHITINETYGDKGVYLGSFGQPTCFVSDVKASGTNGGVAVIGDNVRDLNTTEGDCSFLSLSGGKFTLETGAYNIEASVIALRVDGHQARLRNFTDTVNSCIGSSEISLNGNNTATRSFIECRVVSIDPAKQYDIVHYLEANNGGLNQVLGRAVGAPTDEVYTQVKITKVR